MRHLVDSLSVPGTGVDKIDKIVDFVNLGRRQAGGGGHRHGTSAGGICTRTGVNVSGGKGGKGASQRGVVRGHSLPEDQKGQWRDRLAAYGLPEGPDKHQDSVRRRAQSRPENVTYNVARWAQVGPRRMLLWSKSPQIREWPDGEGAEKARVRDCHFVLGFSILPDRAPPGLHTRASARSPT